MRKNRWIGGIVASILLAVAAIFAVPVAAQANSGQQAVADGGMWCYNNAPFATQQRESGWIVNFTGMSGTVGQNDWRCQYTVIATVPMAAEEIGQTNDYTLPPVHTSLPVDWAAACKQQYGGDAGLVWIPGPVMVPGAVTGWVCVA